MARGIEAHVPDTFGRLGQGSLPLVGQIVAQTLEALVQHSTFDSETIACLVELAKSGGLTKYEQVVLALGTKGGK